MKSLRNIIKCIKIDIFTKKYDLHDTLSSIITYKFTLNILSYEYTIGIFYFKHLTNKKQIKQTNISEFKTSHFLRQYNKRHVGFFCVMRA